MYDPSTGRFISEDPLGQYAGDVNVYRYVGNSPFAATDPSGQLAWFAPALFGAALGVGFNTLNNYSRGKKGWALLDGAGYAALGGAIGGASFVGMRGAGFSIAAAAAYSGFLSGGANEYADAVAEGRNPSAWGVIEKGLWGAIFGTVFGKLTPKQCPIRDAKPKEFPIGNLGGEGWNTNNIINDGRTRLFAKTTETGKSTLRAGEGTTDKFGNVEYSTLGSETDIALARFHESVHSFLSPKLKFLREFRADIGFAAFEKSSLLRYTEEALAETYAQFRVNGYKGITTGLRFPVTNGYVEIGDVATEAVIGSLLMGGLTYAVYKSNE